MLSKQLVKRVNTEHKSPIFTNRNCKTISDRYSRTQDDQNVERNKLKIVFSFESLRS